MGNRQTDDGLRFLHDFPVFTAWHHSSGRETVMGYDGKPNHLAWRGAITDRGFSALRGLDGLFSLDAADAALALSGEAVVPLLDLPNLVRVSGRGLTDEVMGAFPARVQVAYRV